jgi:superfamily II DNA or RNA helicase
VTSVDADAILARAKSVLAREILDAESGPTLIGDVRLHEHQRRAVARVRVLLATAGGALLADSTGLGKTFVALAVAKGVERVLIVGPAALAESWHLAMARARVEARFVSLERLSRGASSHLAGPQLVIVDEAHHLRNRRTKSYAAVAALCDRARVLLLSATPLQNRRADLVAQLALFLGDAAASATDADLARLIVRRRADETIRIPSIDGPRWVRPPIIDDFLDDILALPPPLPGSDEGTAGTLVAYGLLRQWASSRAALVAALRRRIAKAVAMRTSLEAGRWPSREQLAAWTHSADAVQLALPELLIPLGSIAPRLDAMLGAVTDHADALGDLLARIRDAPDPDPIRAATLADICRAHSGARVLAFSQYAETVRALSRLLMPKQNGVAALTASGGRVAGGRVTRREVLAQFSPNGRDAAPAAERIALLVTTDVLSEGLDLQRASVVVHLDLPWNPARLEQRVGRVRRLGSEQETVFVYALAPPARSESMLRVVERLRAKLGMAARIVGLESAVIPEAVDDDPIAPPELASKTHALLATWRDSVAASSMPNDSDAGVPMVAGVQAPHDGFLALLASGRERFLLASLDGSRPSLGAAAVSRTVEMGREPAIVPTAAETRRAVAAVRAWSRDFAARRRLSIASPAGSRVRIRIAARITALLSSAPRHQRATLASLASAAQRALCAPLGAGAERALVALAGAAEADAKWLRDIATLGAGRDSGRMSSEPEPLVVIVLRRPPDGGKSGDRAV